jgi:hypothetical protein
MSRFAAFFLDDRGPEVKILIERPEQEARRSRLGVKPSTASWSLLICPIPRVTEAGSPYKLHKSKNCNFAE